MDNWYYLIQDIACILKKNLHIVLYKTNKLLEPMFIISWFNAIDFAVFKTTQAYYYVVVVEIKTPYHMYTLEEILAVAANAGQNEITFYIATTDNFYWLNTFIHSSAQGHKILLSIKANELHKYRVPLELNSKSLALIVDYFEPIQTNYTVVSPACLRLHLEDAAISPLWLFEKIAHKTVFIVHKKNNEYFRIGPFSFNKIDDFFKTLFTFDDSSELNSEGGGTVRTVAYIDIYS